METKTVKVGQAWPACMPHLSSVMWSTLAAMDELFLWLLDQLQELQDLC